MFKFLNPFGDDFGNFLYQTMLFCFAIILICVIGYQIKYRNVKEVCTWHSVAGTTLEKNCRDSILK